MKNIIPRFVVFLTVLSLVSACKNPPENFPNDLDGLGGNLNQDYIDSLKIYGKTVLNDSTRGDLRTWGVLGSFHDPELGITTASIYAAYRPVTYYPSGIPGYTNVDSVVVSLAYYPNQIGYGYADKYKGVTEINVHPIKEKLPVIGTNVTTHSTFTIGKSLGSLRFVPRQFDEVPVGDTTLPAQIRIKLNNSIGEEILNFNPALSSENMFENYFYGLCFKATPQLENDKGCLLYFHLTSVYSRLQIYYSKTGGGTGVWEALIRDGSQRINTYKHNYASSNLGTALNSTLAGETNLYLQPGVGTAVKLFIPGLVNLNPDKNTIINKAQLVVPVDNTLSGKFRKPSAIALVKKNSDGVLLFLEDYGQNTNDGIYDAEKNRYVFNITRHVNKVASGAIPNDTLVLSLQGAGTFMERLILKGTESSSPSERVRIELFYSKVP